ncbi:hypothetical protein ACFFX0_25285 [Citricoccus parietis]|uniref:Uncharacterized protein n=1 Tax=Citricoccus parietis TaxID=592307 RepID=A0ABV5G5V6_9MICC
MASASTGVDWCDRPAISDIASARLPAVTRVPVLSIRVTLAVRVRALTGVMVSLLQFESLSRQVRWLLARRVPQDLPLTIGDRPRIVWMAEAVRRSHVQEGPRPPPG